MTFPTPIWVVNGSPLLRENARRRDEQRNMRGSEYTKEGKERRDEERADSSVSWNSRELIESNTPIATRIEFAPIQQSTDIVNVDGVCLYQVGNGRIGNECLHTMNEVVSGYLPPFFGKLEPSPAVIVSIVTP